MSLPVRKILALVLVFSIALTFTLSVSAAPGGNGASKLTKHDRELLSEARLQGKTSVTLLIAALPGANNAVVNGLASLGATVRYQDNDLSYIRADVPVNNVEAASALNGVQAANVDEVIPLVDPRPEADGTNAVPAPGPGTPGLNPYMPTQDIGAPQFIAQNPTYDGRGVKIGILDTGIDLLTPELQSAKTLDGQPTRKIVDWVTATDPFGDNDPTWVNMQDQVTASGNTFTYKGVAYTAPANGSYRIGLFNERDPRLGGELGNDVNRDGNPAGSSGIFAVLWNTNSNTVWVDVNQNNSFADEKGMTDYRANYDIGVFGTDNPATAERDTVPFVVQTDGKNKVVNIGIVSGAHGTHVAGITAGKGFFGGAFNGAAPEAQIVSIRVCLFIAGCTAHALIEGMIFAEKQANVDVINMSIGGLPALNDGNNTRAILYNRLITQYKAQMFISAGNDGPGVNSIGDPSVATNVMSIGAYWTKDSYFANYGADVTKAEGLFYFSSRGPREDGGFKPDIVAPGSAISTIPGWQPGSPVAGTYNLPPGYGMFNGTSMAAPAATGGAALLISAAKQTGAQWKPDQLRQAIKSSARFLSGYGAHEQGNGLFQIGAAWDLLKQNIKTVDISSSAPVNTIISQFLATPNTGQGIYEREGWAAGQSGERTISFVRTSGGSKPVTYNLSWVGNDGTFSSAGTIALPANTPVSLVVKINAETEGVHSAILNLDDPNTTGIDYQVMNTVIAASQFTAAQNYTVTRTGQADRADKATFFFNVPANTPAFKVDVTGVNGRVRVIRYHPYGVPFDSTSTTGYQTGGNVSRTVSNPTPGVWEVTVDAHRTSAAIPTTFTVTGSILGASVAPNPDVITSATANTPINRSYSITNIYGAFTGRAVGTNLGSAKRSVNTIANHAQQQFVVNVAPGSSSLRATIGSPSDLAADLDLYVYNCTSGSCVLSGQSATGSSEESVTIANPAAGNWVVLIDGYSVPAGTTTYNYIDIFSNAAFGNISVADANALRPAGSTWTVAGTVTPKAAPAAGRVLLGNVQVRTDANTLIGSNDVVIENVAP